MKYSLSHLRISAVEKCNLCSEMVNIAQLCGNKEFIYEFKTSLRCRDPDGDFYLLICDSKKIYLWRLTWRLTPTNNGSVWRSHRGRFTGGPEVG